MNFEFWLSQQGVALQPWAREASEGLLRVMYRHRTGPSGKSFLMLQLVQFAGVAHGRSFETWIREQGVTLRPWQKAAAEAFFAVSPVVRDIVPNRTFLIKKLAEFVIEYGNSFEISKEDDVQAFVRAKCQSEEGATTTVKSIYGSYLAFCKEKGFRSNSLTTFIRRVRTLRPEMEERICRGMKCWVGVRV